MPEDAPIAFNQQSIADMYFIRMLFDYVNSLNYSYPEEKISQMVEELIASNFFFFFLFDLALML